MTRDQLRKNWADRVAAFQASGQSVAAWCASHHIEPHQLYYWLRKLRAEADLRDTRAAFPQCLSVEIDERPIESQAPLFIRVGQVVIEVKSGCELALLADVVRMLTTLYSGPRKLNKRQGAV